MKRNCVIQCCGKSTVYEKLVIQCSEISYLGQVHFWILAYLRMKLDKWFNFCLQSLSLVSETVNRFHNFLHLMRYFLEYLRIKCFKILSTQPVIIHSCCDCFYHLVAARIRIISNAKESY